MSLVDTAKNISTDVEINKRDLCLMSKDQLVLVINFDEGKYAVVNENLLPFTLKGRLRKSYEKKDYFNNSCAFIGAIPIPYVCYGGNCADCGRPENSPCYLQIGNPR